MTPTTVTLRAQTTAVRRSSAAVSVVALVVALLAIPAAGLADDGPDGRGLVPAPAHLPQTPVVDTTPRVLDLTFPVADPHDRTWFIDDFLHLRGGGSRLHAATDVMAPKHRPIHAAMGGVITFAPYPEPSYGWMISIMGDDGHRYSYIHLNNDTPQRTASGAWMDDDRGGVEHAYAPRIVQAIRDRGTARGLRIERGELIGWNGDSGNAKGVAPHLHLEIEVQHPQGNYRINPYHSLTSALERGDVPSVHTAARRVGPYLDVHAGSTHADAIARLTEAGVLTGCASDRYCPGDAVTRGDLASYLAAALGLDTSTNALAFEDVRADDPRRGAIAAVGRAGVLFGYDDARFGPDDALNRAQLASVLTRAFGVPPATRSAGFADVGAGATHRAAIDATAQAGLTRGCGDGTRYCGGEDVRRDQIASFLDRGIDFAG